MEGQAPSVNGFSPGPLLPGGLGGIPSAGVGSGFATGPCRGLEDVAATRAVAVRATALKRRGSAGGVTPPEQVREDGAVALDWDRIGTRDSEALLRPRDIYAGLTSRPWPYLRHEQGPVPILAIGVMKSGGDGDDDAERDVDEAESQTSR